MYGVTIASKQKWHSPPAPAVHYRDRNRHLIQVSCHHGWTQSNMGLLSKSELRNGSSIPGTMTIACPAESAF
jgi:hypothetical protein